MLVRRVQMTALLLSLKGSQPKTTCKWRLLQIIISQLVGTYRSSLSSQSSSFALVSVSISMVSSVSVLVSPVSPSSASDSSYTAFTLQSYTLSSLHLCASARSASKVDPFPLTWCSRLLAKEKYNYTPLTSSNFLWWKACRIKLCLILMRLRIKW